MAESEDSKPKNFRPNNRNRENRNNDDEMSFNELTNKMKVLHLSDTKCLIESKTGQIIEYVRNDVYNSNRDDEKSNYTIEKSNFEQKSKDPQKNIHESSKLTSESSPSKEPYWDNNFTNLASSKVSKELNTGLNEEKYLSNRSTSQEPKYDKDDDKMDLELSQIKEISPKKNEKLYSNSLEQAANDFQQKKDNMGYEYNYQQKYVSHITGEMIINKDKDKVSNQSEKIYGIKASSRKLESTDETNLGSYETQNMDVTVNNNDLTRENKIENYDDSKGSFSRQKSSESNEYKQDYFGKKKQDQIKINEPVKILLGKHYVEPKHNKTVSFGRDESNVKVTVKPETVLQTLDMDTLLRDECRIKKIETIDDIDAYCDTLIVELKKLKDKKFKLKYDVSGDIDDLKHKIKLLIEVKQKILDKEEIKEQSKSDKQKEPTKPSYADVVTPKRHVHRNDKEVKKDVTNVASSSTQISLKEKFFEICEKSKTFKNFDVLFLFHEMTLEDEINFIKESSKNHSYVRFAVGFYTRTNFLTNLSNLRLTSEYCLMMCDFDKSDFKPIGIQHKMKTRDEINYLSWNPGYLKLVVNIGKNKPFLSEFVSLNDEEGAILAKKGVYFEKYLIDCSCIDKRLIDHLFNHYLNESLQRILNITYLKELYFLKRHQFNSYEEYKMEKQEAKYKNQYSKFIKKDFGSYRICMNTYKKGYSFDSPISHDFYDEYLLNFDSKITEPSKDLYMISANYFDYTQRKRIKVWLEIIAEKESINRMLDIHLTAKYIINEFNAVVSKSVIKLSFHLDISDVRTGKHGDILFFVKFVNLDIENSEIKILDSNTQKLLDALSHFSYHHTHGKLVLFDIRPLTVDYLILITEPVIFSTLENRFSSSDLGIKGIEKFKHDHKCNSICTSLKITKF